MIDFYASSFTIQHVHGQSHRAWCYHFYVVLREYEEKDMFIPPLNLLLFPLSYYLRKSEFHPMNISVVFHFSFIDASKQDKSRKRIEMTDHEREQFQRHQQRIAEKYWKENQTKEKRPSKKMFFYDTQ